MVVIIKKKTHFTQKCVLVLSTAPEEVRTNTIVPSCIVRTTVSPIGKGVLIVITLCWRSYIVTTVRLPPLFKQLIVTAINCWNSLYFYKGVSISVFSHLKFLLFFSSGPATSTYLPTQAMPCLRPSNPAAPPLSST